MIPATTAAYLDDVYVKTAITLCENRQFGSAARLPRGGTQLIAENIVHQPQIFPAAYRAPLSRFLPVEPAGAQQVGGGVTHLVRADSAFTDITKQRSPLQRVVYV